MVELRNKGGIMATSREDLLEQRRRIARHVTTALAASPTISAILVFGSVASGQVDEHSDIDLFVFCQPTIPSGEERARWLASLGTGWHQYDQPQGDSLFAHMDSDGLVDDVLVSLHYQTVAWVDLVLREVIEQGMITSPSMPFRAYTFPALLQRGWLVHDPSGVVTHWREHIRIFPLRLKMNLLHHFVPILCEQVEDLLITAERNLGPGTFLFLLTRATDALTSILFAVNEIYDPADRRSEQLCLPILTNVPHDFLARLTAILQGPFDPEGAVSRAQAFAQLSQEVLVLTEEARKGG